jgi:hypothetical protein
MGQSWTLLADAAYSGTEFEFYELRESWNGGLQGLAETEYRDDASIAILSLAVGRRFRAIRTAEVELSLGGALQRLQLFRPDCRPLPPSQGIGGTTCGPLFGGGTPRWEPTYTAPSLSSAASLRVPLARRLAAEFRIGHQIGRGDTESFYQDLIPELDQYEAPTQTTIATFQLSVGLAWRP